ncbi:MAG TPA: thioesterase [Bryobacteraceae bacterium]|jgi:predicted thioesterase|nr:thioesterase [Bryobacteraceae bacterium]
MANLTIGAKGERTVLVTSDIAISFLGLENARVLSTPEMIRAMEQTCRDLVLPMLDAGHDTVGTHVNVAHLAAAPMGTAVRFEAEITGVLDGRRVQFRVAAIGEKDRIGEGTHERTIINVAKFAAKMAAKKA